MDLDSINRVDAQKLQSDKRRCFCANVIVLLDKIRLQVCFKLLIFPSDTLTYQDELLEYGSREIL